MSACMLLIPIAVVIFTSTTDNLLGEALKTKNVKEFKTQFNDKEVLLETLKQYCLPIELLEDNIKTSVEGYDLLFTKTKECYILKVLTEDIKRLNELYIKLKEFDKEYKKNVQGKVYENLIRKIDKTDMKVIEEDYLEDNSVLITLSVD
ncbi:hypothetical protein [Clostridium chrysemydis]|uniref:hypothetical protein n=1 Tax=Clostridium chrysemydis TaxID=2665504 RepID=UPI00188403BE|nr:hypothetical protein [Clostridium chrysemydis]